MSRESQETKKVFFLLKKASSPVTLYHFLERWSAHRSRPAKDSCFIAPFQFGAPACALNKPCFTMCLSELDYVLCQSVRMRALISTDTCHVNGLSDDTPLTHCSQFPFIKKYWYQLAALVLAPDRDSARRPSPKPKPLCVFFRLSPPVFKSN